MRNSIKICIIVFCLLALASCSLPIKKRTGIEEAFSEFSKETKKAYGLLREGDMVFSEAKFQEFPRDYRKAQKLYIQAARLYERSAKEFDIVGQRFAAGDTALEAAVAAELASLHDEAAGYYEKASEYFEKEKYYSGAARSLEKAGLTERALGLYLKGILQARGIGIAYGTLAEDAGDLAIKNGSHKKARIFYGYALKSYAQESRIEDYKRVLRERLCRKHP